VHESAYVCNGSKGYMRSRIGLEFWRSNGRSMLCSAEGAEVRMTGILDKFYVEHGVHGARVMARSPQLTGDCIEDDEIDTAIEMLKDDLDACGKEMKRLVAVNQRGAFFEGWPPEA
jgi:hypothetical protein